MTVTLLLLPSLGHKQTRTHTKPCSYLTGKLNSHTVLHTSYCVSFSKSHTTDLKSAHYKVGSGSDSSTQSGFPHYETPRGYMVSLAVSLYRANVYLSPCWDRCQTHWLFHRGWGRGQKTVQIGQRVPLCSQLKMSDSERGQLKGQNNHARHCEMVHNEGGNQGESNRKKEVNHV